jgi:hypothetical protein
VNFFGVVSLWILLSRIRKNLMLLLHFMCLLLMGTYNSSLSQEKELPWKILFPAQRRTTVLFYAECNMIEKPCSR